MPSQHIWTEKDGDGLRREVRATKFGGVWRFQSKTDGEMTWTYHDAPLLDDLQKLKEIVARKYQRRRASTDDIASVDKLIQEREANDAPSPRLRRGLVDGEVSQEQGGHD